MSDATAPLCTVCQQHHVQGVDCATYGHVGRSAAAGAAPVDDMGRHDTLVQDSIRLYHQASYARAATPAAAPHVNLLNHQQQQHQLQEHSGAYCSAGAASASSAP